MKRSTKTRPSLGRTESCSAVRSVLETQAEHRSKTQKHNVLWYLWLTVRTKAQEPKERKAVW